MFNVEIIFGHKGIISYMLKYKMAVYMEGLFWLRCSVRRLKLYSRSSESSGLRCLPLCSLHRRTVFPKASTWQHGRSRHSCPTGHCWQRAVKLRWSSPNTTRSPNDWRTNTASTYHWATRWVYSECSSNRTANISEVGLWRINQKGSSATLVGYFLRIMTRKHNVRYWDCFGYFTWEISPFVVLYLLISLGSNG